MPAGRPTTYDPSYCEVVIEMGKQGKSKAQMAARFNVARSSIDAWAEANPEFSEAINIAMSHAQDWWENAGQEGMFLGGGGFNANVWKKSMEARFRDDYTERKEVHSTGDLSIKHSVAELTDEELAALVAKGL